MKYNTIFFVNIVQLFYACEVWSKPDYGVGYTGQPNPDVSDAGPSYSVSQFSGAQYPSPRYPRSPRCSLPRKPKFAYMRCRRTNSKQMCTATCISHHFFQGTEQKRMVLTCRGNNWKPRPKFPKCVSDGKCKLDLVKAREGNITCKSEKAVVRCTITCKGRDYGWFICRESGKFSRPLPKCVK